MNRDNLNKLINRYTANYESFNKKNNEVFKWAAVKQFRNVWFSNEHENLPFSQLFNEAKKSCSVLIDNSRVAPTSGIVKMAEYCPDEVEHLFKSVLFSNTTDAAQIQANMECFLDGIEAIRIKHFPQCWKYKQDRHAASCYLSFFNPEVNYIYRYSEAEEFASYIEFGFDIGSGETFSLPDYYKLCDVIVEAIKQHDDLIDLYKKQMESSDEYYYDKSFHLLAFDLMYCCRCYNLYSGLEHKAKSESIKEFNLARMQEKEHTEYEQKVNAILDRIHNIEIEMDLYRDISIMNVEVSHKTYGTGVVVSQNVNKIKVRFNECEKDFVISKNYLMRPTFSDNDEIVEAFTRYDTLNNELISLNHELKRLR